MNDSAMDDWNLETSSVVSSCSTLNGDLKHPQFDRPSGRNRRIVLVSLFLAALVFGLATYFVMLASQHAEFESSFESFARETADIAENNAENSLGHLRNLATAITSQVVDNEQATFPFVTIPHFDLRTQEIADLTGIEMILFVPFVTQQDAKTSSQEQQAHDDWETYTMEHQDWILQDYNYRGWDPSTLTPIPRHIYNYTLPPNFNETRPGFVDEGAFMEEILSNMSYHPSFFQAPVAQYGPRLVDTSLAKLDLLTHPIFKKEMVASLEYNVPVISETEDLEFLLQHIQPTNGSTTTELRSFTLETVKEDFRNNSRTVGFLVSVVPWKIFFRNLLPTNINGIVVKVVSDCGANFTYVCNGGRDDWAANGDHYNNDDDDNHQYYKDMKQHFPFFWKDHPTGASRHCHFDLVIFPNDEFADNYLTNDPLYYALIVVGVFIVTASLFVVYDYCQQSQQSLFIEEKARAEAIVTSLFPKHVGEQLMKEQQFNTTTHKLLGRRRLVEESMRVSSGNHNNANSRCLSDFLSGEMKVRGKRVKTKPLADLFPSATICFADIVGFTAWSSVREPFQVFTLLETLYQAFDKISKKRKIFKVETIGDCYVAVAGLPKPRPDHALAMAKFSRDCLEKFKELVNMLEVELGPDTADLGLRTGLHSGPVTAGVLRGERARFQLFGDTMNTCSRIESTGRGGRIHLSQECADELIKYKKKDLLVPRKDKVSAKGKGLLTTYWLRLSEDDDVTEEESEDSGDEAGVGSEQEQAKRLSKAKSRKIEWKRASRGPKVASNKALSTDARASYDKQNRLINWNTETLKRLLERVVARRNARGAGPTALTMAEEEAINRKVRSGRMVFDEVQDIIILPDYDQASADICENNSPDELPFDVVMQIREYVTAIAKLYPSNPFHDFDHASHVCMSVVKMLSRVVAPKMVAETALSGELHKQIHDHTYGITSDPITQFACVVSSLIHDVEHPGVPNSQLVKEQVEIAVKYKNISVAEQNSVEVSWNILMEPRFDKLRASIYTTETEMIRFRQLVVNSVMATDIVDKQLKALRNSRWERAFQQGSVDGEVDTDDDVEAINRKATIVIEHLIQASDVSHTMQHWHVFRKWNERLFREMYTAYQAGRAEKDPSEFWYKGEIGFFDFYIIPLAKKLKECGVFGVSSDEYLNYAQSNRREWEQKGEEIVKEYLAAFHKENGKMGRRLSRHMSSNRLLSATSDAPENTSFRESMQPNAKKSSFRAVENKSSLRQLNGRSQQALEDRNSLRQVNNDNAVNGSQKVVDHTRASQTKLNTNNDSSRKESTERTSSSQAKVAASNVNSPNVVTENTPSRQANGSATDSRREMLFDALTPSERDAGFTGVVNL
ncbi:Receptor-type guanylate cyclase gcy [Seminavis robusta]|uniref:Receptor-type guanylate cyclase gcy n=1 Tax=Seminavis robusta TaxID=568900 RepID=A0A9N8EW09_9STRA|nr:Receptor-type guanylate cyclase gcy [Seminavis robusta]|eukprot:Sro1927_g305940.1 Receptor-type guanylate cyclase gcy (1358) ;mRNA; f:5855-11901